MTSHVEPPALTRSGIFSGTALNFIKMFFIIVEEKETILHFLQGLVKVLLIYSTISYCSNIDIKLLNVIL